MRRFWMRALIVLLAIVVLAAAFSGYTVRRSFPKQNGELTVAGLDGSVDVYRDAYGVPHIFAGSEHDLFFAQGYVHAQDRFWQMDFQRHTGTGRLAELFGEDQVSRDSFLRTLGWARVAEVELAQLDPVTRRVLDAYAQGVNAYLADHRGSALSLEYAVLGLINPDYQLEDWTPLDSLVWAKAMAWNLGGNMDEEIARAVLLKTLSEQQLAEYYPQYPANGPFILPDFKLQGSPSGSLPSSYVLPQVALNALEQAGRGVALLENVFGPPDNGLGSNNWVISGSRTATGAPLLANDPHLGIQLPSIWYEVGLYCVPKNAACPFAVTGFSFVGNPGVIIGHNDRIAWGATNVGPDVQDLFIERINPDNPNQYEVNGQWLDMTLIKETIRVAGGEPVEITVRLTRNGPIVSDTYGKLENFEQQSGILIPEEYAVALRWTALEQGEIASTFLGLNRAQNWEDFRQALALFTAPSQNFVYADVDGNIGYQTPGHIPLRASGDGRLPVPGWTDEFGWMGYIPFDELPTTYNPERGYVATANNAVVPPDYPYLLGTDFDFGYRQARIVEMIENAPGLIDAAYIARMQGDNYNLNADTLVPTLLNIPLQDSRLEAARRLLEDWDFQNHMDSAPAALFEAFWKHLVAETYFDQIPERFWPSNGDASYLRFSQLQTEPGSAWWDNISTPEHEDRDVIFQVALRKAVDELEGRLGKDPQSWKWGDLHGAVFEEQTLGKSGISIIEALFNRGPFPTSGGSDIVNATNWRITGDFSVSNVPSMRMIVDLSDLSRSLSIHTTGQSGHAYHPNYIDMADPWRNIQYHPMLYGLEQVRSQARAHLILNP